MDLNTAQSVRFKTPNNVFYHFHLVMHYYIGYIFCWSILLYISIQYMLILFHIYLLQFAFLIYCLSGYVHSTETSFGWFIDVQPEPLLCALDCIWCAQNTSINFCTDLISLWNKTYSTGEYATAHMASVQVSKCVCLVLKNITWCYSERKNLSKHYI